VLSAGETRALLPMPELVDAVGRAFATPPAAPQRLVLADDGQDWVVMPGLSRRGGIVCKLLRVGHGDAADDGPPTISGIVALLDAAGRLLALLDGAALTARRTAAIAAYATGLLAGPDASVLALFGAGALAREHVESLAVVRPLAEIRVVGRSPDRVRSLCEQLAADGHDVRATDAHEAMQGADIVVAATTSSTPVFADEDVAPGTHVNAMGSYRPQRAEIPAATVARARVVVETKATAWHEAGDLIQARDAGLIGEDHVYAELHERGRIAALREAEPDAVTLFKSVGHVALDLAALGVALDRLRDRPA
jgi:ornithine cyclodeaminase/alanine dehydrogenase-like protein (mu-crystallin family)